MGTVAQQRANPRPCKVPGKIHETLLCFLNGEFVSLNILVKQLEVWHIIVLILPDQIRSQETALGLIKPICIKHAM